MKNIFRDHKKLFIILSTLIVLFLLSYLLDFSKDSVKWGVTFSQTYAQDELGVNWQEAYTAILDELQIDNIRLSAYWNKIEKERDVYDFTDLDWQISEASKRGVDITLAVGRKLPRWPECHDPSWISHLNEEDIRQEQLELVTLVASRYADVDNITKWQVENEPFLSVFGECPPLDEEALKSEIDIVKKLTNKPIVVTDSGELNFWIKAAATGSDIVGTTLYRVVYNEKMGYLKYPISPLFYYAKASLIKLLFNTSNVINSELQTEAWHTEKADLTQASLEDQFKSMSIDQFKKNIKFARRAGYDEVYLWGVEWWYYLKTQRDYPNFWEEAKTIWQ
jgi:hypothetical protein